MADVKIGKTTKDKETLLSSRIIKIGDYEIITPFRVLDFNDVASLRQFSYLSKNYLDKIDLVERSRVIRRETFVKEANNPEADFLFESYDSFKRIESLKKKIIINTLTFSFNPFGISQYNDYLKSLFHIYHYRSDILLVPNLKVLSYNKKIVKRVSEEEFVKYINLAYDALSFRTSKPVFVPLPLKYGIKAFRDIFGILIDNGYRYFWMDLEGSSSISKASHIRAFHEKVENAGLDDKILLYTTNVRRELHPHIRESRCGASDILISPLGADLLGVNREPMRRNVPSKQIDKEELLDHRARFLNREDYYYMRFSSFEHKEELLRKFGITEGVLRSRPKFYTSFVNTFEINAEFDIHKKIVREEDSLWNYLNKKAAITQDILKAIKKIIKKKPAPEIELDAFL